VNQIYMVQQIFNKFSEVFSEKLGLNNEEEIEKKYFEKNIKFCF